MASGRRPGGTRRLSPVELPSWALPLIVVAVALPIVVAVALGGPPAGFAVGAAVATAILVVAARTRYDEPIEVARSDDGHHRVLVVATVSADDPRAVKAVAEALRDPGGARSGSGAEVLVLAPALNRGLSHWASDLREARLAAQERLTISLAALAGIPADLEGRVGDTDPVQAVEDTLASFPAQEVVFVTSAGGRGEVDEVRRRLDRPVRHVEVEAGEPPPVPDRS